MTFIKAQVRNALHSRAVIYAIFTVLPIVIMIVGEQIALPAFVFEHLMVILVVAAAVAGGPGPAVASAVSGGVGDNLSAPGTYRCDQPGCATRWTSALFLVVAVVVGWLVNGLRTARANAVTAARREQEAREELDRSVATVTHDLATPLTAIRGTIQFALKTRGGNRGRYRAAPQSHRNSSSSSHIARAGAGRHEIHCAAVAVAGVAVDRRSRGCGTDREDARSHLGSASNRTGDASITAGCQRRRRTPGTRCGKSDHECHQVLARWRSRRSTAPRRRGQRRPDDTRLWHRHFSRSARSVV